MIKTKVCPICGKLPVLRQEVFDIGKCRSYSKQYYVYQYACGYCRLLKSEEMHDIYISSEEAKGNAAESWNEEVDRIIRIMIASE